MTKSYKILLSCLLLLLTAIILSLSVFNSRNNYKIPKNIYEKGKQDAANDITNGKYILKRYGLPSSDGSDGLWAEMLYEKKGIVIEFVAGDQLQGNEGTYWDGYNSISIKAIENRFGKNILDSVLSLAVETIKKEGTREYRIPKIEEFDIFKIEEPGNTALPDSLGGLSCYGDFNADFTVSSTGVVSNVKLFGIRIYSDPFSNPGKWYCRMDSIPPNNYFKKVSDWAIARVKKMQVIVNLKHPRWYSNNMVDAGYQFKINPNMDINNAIHFKQDYTPIPKRLIPANWKFRSYVYVWIDKNGRVISYKIASITLERRAKINNLYQLVYRSYEDKNDGDVSEKPSGDLNLANKFEKYIKQRVYKTTYVVNPNHEYFKFHDVAKILLQVDPDSD